MAVFLMQLNRGICPKVYTIFPRISGGKKKEKELDVHLCYEKKIQELLKIWTHLEYNVAHE